MLEAEAKLEALISLYFICIIHAKQLIEKSGQSTNQLVLPLNAIKYLQRIN